MKKFLTLFLVMTVIFSLSSHAQQNVGIGTTSPLTTLDVNGGLSLREGTALTLSSSASNNNIAIGNNSFFRISGPTTAFTITGLVPPTGANGMIVTLYNTTAFPMTIANDATSTTANQITTLTGANITTPAGPNVVQLQYNANQSKWILIGGQNITSIPASWNLTGNSGLTSDFGTPSNGNFVGTTSSVPFSIRVNNVRAGFVDNTTAAGSSSTFLGYLAGNFGTFGTFTQGPASLQNVYVGYEAGTTNGSASAEANDNVGIGYLADANSTTGAYNTSLGAQAFEYGTGTKNVALGYNALAGPSTFLGGPGLGTENTAVGYGALAAINEASNSVGNNTAIGYSAGAAATSAVNNVFVGSSAGSGVTTSTATNNVFLGTNAGATGTSITTGAQNTFLGASTGSNSATYSNSTALGYNAAITASNQVVIGNSSVTTTEFNGALMPSTGTNTYSAGTTGQVLTSKGAGVPPQWSTPSSGWSLTGNSGLTSDFGTPAGGNFVGTTTAVPFSVRVNNVRAAFIDNTTSAGSSSTFLGYLAGNFGTYGTFTQGPASYQNVYIGYQAGTTNGSASAEANDNVGIGYDADISSTTGTYNTSVGALAFENGTGSSNTAIGYEALMSPPSTFLGGPGTAAFNTALGYEVGTGVTSGGNNVFIGDGAAPNITSGTGNVIIGDKAGTNTHIGTNVSGKLIIESQNANSQPLITGDFASHTVALGGVLTLHTAETSTTTIGGHLDVQSSSIPSETATTFGAGGTYTVTPTSSTDVAGSLSITPGSSTTASVTFTFGGTYTNAPIVIITPTNANAAGATAYISATTATTFTITLTGVTSTAYTFNYFVIETQ